MGFLKEPEAKTKRSRAGVNTIVPDLIYQRGQIYTWSRAVKQRRLEEWGVSAIINFWPKVDPDLAEVPLDWYWQLSSPRSEEMLEPRMLCAADAVANYLELQNTGVLVLCEAGKTRSVFFCILLYHAMGHTWEQSQEFVLGKVPSAMLKGFMLDWLADQK